MELENRIYESLVERLELDDELLSGFTYDTPLFNTGDGSENLGLDSIDALELVSLLYENWDLDVPTEDMKKLSTVNAIADYIRKAGREN